jgi:hypothetical protein
MARKISPKARKEAERIVCDEMSDWFIESRGIFQEIAQNVLVEKIARSIDEAFSRGRNGKRGGLFRTGNPPSKRRIGVMV